MSGLSEREASYRAHSIALTVGQRAGLTVSNPVAIPASAHTAARDEGFSAGTIAALGVVTAMDCGVTWGEIVRAAGTQQILQHALTNEGDWEWAGFKRYAKNELGVTEIRKARAAVKRRAPEASPLPKEAP